MSQKEENEERHTSLYQFALATNSCPHKTQGFDVCIQNLWLCTPLPKFSTSSDLCRLEACFLQVNDALLYHPKEALSLTFSFTVPIWWNDLPNSIRAAESLPIFKKRLKHISSIFIWHSNSSNLYSTCFIFYLLYNNKKTCYVYCIRLTETCSSTCVSLLFCWLWLLPLSSFVSRFG